MNVKWWCCWEWWWHTLYVCMHAQTQTHTCICACILISLVEASFQNFFAFNSYTNQHWNMTAEDSDDFEKAQSAASISQISKINRQFRLKSNKKSNVISMVQELYLRKDVPCKSFLCQNNCTSNKGKHGWVGLVFFLCFFLFIFIIASVSVWPS